jgi:glycosyltransferase involved in cell wall biosynthesis
MRILLVTTGLLTGGAEMQIAALAGEYVRQGHTVAILNLLGQTEITVHPAVHMERLHLRAANATLRYARLPAAFRQASRFIAQWQPDVVHSHMVKANLFARLLRLMTPMPRLICTAHSLNEGGRVLMGLYRLTDGLCELTTHVSAQAAALFVQRGAVPRHKMRHMPNGIDTQRFDLPASPPHPVTPFVWLHVGRLVPEKSQHILLQAFAQVVQTQPTAQLWIAGSGPCEAALQQLSQTLGLSDQVRFLGRRSDVPQLMHAASACVLSSHIEGSPLVLAEALACGLPCVSTDAPGVRALLTPHDRIVPVGDAQALARAMLDTAQSNDSNALRQQRRNHIVTHFSLPAITLQWLRLYEGLT